MVARKREAKRIFRKKKEFVFSWKMLLFLVVLGVFLGYLGYSVFVFNKSGAEEEGVVVCNEDGSRCEATFHWHAYLDIEVCGKRVFVPLEKGDLSGPHTHKERNRIHWHDKVLYDNLTKSILDKSEFTLGAFFDAVGIKFDSNCFGEVCKGLDVCGDERENNLMVFMNGKENFEFRDYVWKDGDKIKIEFGRL